MNADWFGLVIKRDIFPDGIRPNAMGYGVSLHYPNQFFRSYDNSKWDWPNHIQSQNQSHTSINTGITFNTWGKKYASP